MTHAPIDRQLSPPGLAAINRRDVAQGNVMLNIGCGAGQTLLQRSDRVGPDGQVIAVVLSPFLLDVARHRNAVLPQVRQIKAVARIPTLPDAHAMFLIAVHEDGLS